MADAGGIRAGRAYIELGVNDRIAAGLARAKARLLTFGRSLRSFGGDLSAVSGSAFAGAAAVTGGLAAAVRSYVSHGSALKDMSQRTGMSVEALSELGYAAEQSGSSLEAVETGVKRMQRSLYDAQAGTKTAVDALAALGLKAEDLQGQLPDAQFATITAALARIEDPSQKAALSLVLFGRAGTQLLPMLDEASGGLDALRQRARGMGIVISGPGANAAEALGDAFTDVGRTLKAVAFAVGESLAPTLMNATAAITSFAVGVGKWVKANQAIIASAGLAAVAVGGLATAVLAVGTAMTIAAPVFSLLAGGVGLIGSAFGAMMSPIGLVIAGVAAAGYAFVKLTATGQASVKWLGESFSWLAGTARDQFSFIARIAGDSWGGIVDAFATGDIGLALQIALAGASVAWQAGIDKLKTAWLSFKADIQVVAVSMLAGVREAWAKTADWFWSSFPSVAEFFATTWANAIAAVKTAFYSVIGVAKDVKAKIDEMLGRPVPEQEMTVGDVKRKAEAMRKNAQLEYGRSKMIGVGPEAAIGLVNPEYAKRKQDEREKKYVDAMAEIDEWAVLKMNEARMAGRDDDPLAQVEAERQSAINAAKQRGLLSEAGQSPLASELAKIEAEKDAAIAAIIEANAATSGESLDALAEAQAKLRAAIAQAKLFRESAEGWAAVNAAPPRPAPEAIEEAASKMSVQGTFLASSVGGLAGASTLTKIAAATERTARAAEETAAGIQAIGENEA